jgi:RimJ/RimL family protein N-acetyltransferase
MLDKYTHNGIGNKMLHILEKWARENSVHKIECEIRHVNIASIANCIKNGFVITGIHHDAAFINGKWVDEYILEKILEK